MAKGSPLIPSTWKIAFLHFITDVFGAPKEVLASELCAQEWSETHPTLATENSALRSASGRASEEGERVSETQGSCWRETRGSDRHRPLGAEPRCSADRMHVRI